MIHINKDDIADIFVTLKEAISPDANKAILSLENLHPEHHEIEKLEWRYRLSGYAEGLVAADLINSSNYNHLVSTLFGKMMEVENRLGRDFKYSVDIHAEKDRTFTFDVPAMNPIDAYVQLTKRIAYKSIPGIISVLVYSGFEADRQITSIPLKKFSQDELVFVS